MMINLAFCSFSQAIMRSENKAMLNGCLNVVLFTGDLMDHLHRLVLVCEGGG